MVNRDQVPILMGIGAIVATLSAGTCSTNARMDDGFQNVNRRIDDVNRRMDDGFQNVNRRIDDSNKSIDDLQIEIRELRTLFFESIGNQPSSAPAG